MGKRLGVSEDYLATGAERDDDSGKLIEAEIAMRLDESEVARELYEEVLATSATDDERARALAGLGQIAFRLGKPRVAIARLEEARVLWRNGLAGNPSAADTLGRAYAMVDQLEPAIAIFRGSLAAAEEQNDPAETVRFAVLLANAYVDALNFDAAEELLARTRALAPDARDPIFRARLYWSHSRLDTLRGDHRAAARSARRALTLLEATEHTYYAARAHQLLAHIELDRGRPEAALELLEQGFGLLGKSGNPLDLALFKLEEARALTQLGRHEEAGSLAMEASGGLAEGRPHDAGRGYALIAEVFEELGDRAKARELYELAIETLQGQPGRYLTEVYQKLSQLLEAEGQKDEALEVLKKAVAVRTEPSA